jgi:GDP-D-mannose 3',5'-epimerase
VGEKRVLVTGASGFIGQHLVRRLKRDGFWVRGVDIKEPEYAPAAADEFARLDLRHWDDCLQATRGIDQVYNLAADMGGIGYLTANLADIARNNILINTHMLEASRIHGVSRYLFSSSACVYAQSKQKNADVTPLKEEDAFPAEPEPGYGWEKFYTEELCRYYRHDYGFATRIVRLHNVYGPHGTYEGGKEKAPAAICRKVALLDDGDEIEIWGDGQQTRSFLYIDDCVEGMLRLMASDYPHALNLGTDRLVTIDELVDLVAGFAGKKLIKRHELGKPQGVRGRNSDNTRLREVLKWEPSISLEAGLSITYRWIESELRKAGRIPRSPVTRTATEFPRINILGVGVHAINMAQAVELIDAAMGDGRKAYVCVTGVQGVMEAQRDAVLKAILNQALLTTPDGMPMVWVGRWQGFHKTARVYGPDLMLEICRLSVERGYTHFLYGGRPGTAEQLKIELAKRFPGIRIVGTHTPPFRELTRSEETELIKLTNSLNPDFFWVGLSTPKQEKFMAHYLGQLHTKLMLGVGAAFDIHTGGIADAPAWVKGAGLQWLHRLLQEPRRLWRRYLINNPQFLWRIAFQVTGLKKYTNPA